MSSFFGSDGSFVLQFAVIFAVILAVLTAGVLLVRRLGGGGGLAAKPGQRARQPRLGIVDVYELDRQRQLILLRRDNVEHLLLVGGPNDVVIERNIQRGQRLPSEPILRAEPLPEPADAIPEIEARRPEAPLLEEQAPSFAMPAVVEAPVPRSTVPPPSRQPLSEADIPPEPREDREEPAAPVEPPPPAPEPPRRFLRRSTPALVNPKPDVASERVRSEPTFAVTRQAPPDTTPPPAAAAPPVSVPSVSAPPVSSPAPRAVDAAILSDMARQLEIALSRPATAVNPPPGLARADAAKPDVARPEPEPVAVAQPPVAPPVDPVTVVPLPVDPVTMDPVVDPMAAAMAGASPYIPEPTRDEIADALFEEIVPVEEISPPPMAAHPAPEPSPPEAPHAEAPVSDHQAEAAHAILDAEPIQVEPIQVEPVPAEAEPVKAVETTATHPPAPKETAPKEAAPTPKPNPFSVEEIEAEFARLLGRPLEKRN